MKRLGGLVAPVVGVVVFFGTWELLVRAFDVQRFLLPAPSRIVGWVADDPGFYLRNSLVTLSEALAGLTIALILALVIGTLMSYSRWLERAGQPVVVLLQVTPIVAYAPALAIWLNGGIRSVLAIITLICFVPFLFASVIGLRSVDPATLELVRSVDASRREELFRLRFPHALPFLFSAARVAIGLSLIGAVLGEAYSFSREKRGLGYAIAKATAFNQVDQLWAAILCLALLGSVMILLLGAVERALLRWHPSVSVR